MPSMLSLLLCCTATSADAKLLGAAIIPHGDFAYDPSFAPQGAPREKSQQLHEASQQAGAFIESLTPDVIFITTPHGLELSEEFVIYENSQSAGSATLGNDSQNSSTPHYDVKLTLSTPSFASTLRASLEAAGQKVTGIRGFSDSIPLPISWGEILPLSFVNASATASGTKMPGVVIMGVPYRRFNHSVDMVPEMLQLGAGLAEALDSLTERVAWIVSADLAHTHLPSGPYGYCPCAATFDAAIGEWLRSGNGEFLLGEASAQQKLGAMSCGYTGLVILDGAIESTGRYQWHPNLLALAAPTYYGMAVATISRVTQIVV